MFDAKKTCGVGYCREHNRASTCQLGVETLCVASDPLTPTDATCDGVDDDCDGRVDEDFMSRASTCGLGVCQRSGTLSCQSGSTSDSCAVGPPNGPDDSSCNGRDDDCGGNVYEGFVTMVTTCSIGPCAADGITACVDGTVVDSCMASAPSGTDNTCNNLDEDCDGRTDESFVSTASNCGIGACRSSGVITCSSGRTRDSCRAGTPLASDDTTCDNVDDDCSGQVDEDFVVAATNCGVGFCTSSGSRACSGGTVRDSCRVGSPRTSADDAFLPGNGVDDDCDGRVDEDVPPCDTTPLRYEAGAYNNIAVPGGCRSVTVRLWGCGGGGGGNASASGGTGGPGGYATTTVLVFGAMNLDVGSGGANNCNDAGSNAGASTYGGGIGGTGAGANGQDGSVSGGGSGGSPGTGIRGGPDR